MQEMRAAGKSVGWIFRGLFPIFQVGWVTRWILLGLFFLVPLTFVMHFTEIRMEVLEIGTRAPRYVVSQADFSFLDQEATQTLKQEATRDIGAIYRISEQEVLSYRQDLENSLIEHQQWRRELPRTTFEDLYFLLDQMQEILLQERFTDTRTVKKIRSLHLDCPPLVPLDTQSIKDSFEALRPVFLAQDKAHIEAINYLIFAFAHHEWPLQPDFALQEGIQREVRSNIQDCYTHIEEGVQIIKKGEVVTEQHIRMLQAMKGALDEANDWWNPIQMISSIVLALGLVVIAVLHLYSFHRKTLRSFQRTCLLVAILLIALSLAKAVEFLLLSLGSNLVEQVRFPLLVPMTSLLVSILIGTEVAMSVSFFLLMIFGMTLAVDTDPFLLMNFFALALTIFFSRSVHKRTEVFAVCGKVFICLLPAIVAVNLFEGHPFGWNFGMDLISTSIALFSTAVLTLLFLPILESGFGIMTDMTLMEYMDPERELLKRLTMEAPGTYQHSLVVGHIAENAAKAIGANALFCRAATLYHDIGKLFNPHYFTENQLGGFNIHQLLTPAESTKVIIAHVTEGEALARKHGLPQSFINIIREHHGTSMVYYFYCKQVEQVGGDVTQVSEKGFRYAGPKPKSKESAIIMIADTVEAASRSMGETTEKGLGEMVDKLVSKKVEDGQLEESQLTFEELGKIKRAMVKSLLVASHLRIKYPV